MCEMNLILMIVRLIFGVPIVYYFLVLSMHYASHYSWEDSYNYAISETAVGLLFAVICYSIKHSR